MEIRRGLPNEAGWRELEFATDLGYLGEEFPSASEPLLILHHLSDLHVCDSQSPLRPEFLDRWGDADSPIHEQVGIIGTYRPHSILSTQVVEAMVQALNAVTAGPLSGHAITAAIVTGDATDNAQMNEVDWYITLLDGGEVHPDSGDRQRYEGVMDDNPEHYDIKYWHPHGTPAGLTDDEARSKHGFPTIPGLLDAVREPFVATGLNVPWYAVHGNHDALLQGTVTPTQTTQEAQIADRRYEGLPSKLSLAQTLALFNQVGPAGYPDADDAPYAIVTPDVERISMVRGEFIERHLGSKGIPNGHGFDQENSKSKNAYYARQVGGVLLVVMDTVNPFGGWQGSLDQEQFAWLEKTIRDSTQPVVLASHHPLSTIFNGYTTGAPRVCKDELEAMLLKYPQVILWIAGHEHRHHVEWVGEPETKIGFWHVETSSHIDWPQQSRTIEVVRDPHGDIYIGLTVIDHIAGINFEGIEDPIKLAALSRILSANVWQRRPELVGFDGFTILEGTAEERNVVLKIDKRD
eukprot:gene984-993_t